MRKVILLVLAVTALLFCKDSSAQITTYPKYYYGDGKNKPFDKEFDLMIPFKSEEQLYYIYFYKHRGNKPFLKSLAKEKDTLKAPRLNGSWEKLKDTNFLKVEMRYNGKKPYSLLKPSKIYSLIVFKGVTPESKSIIKALKKEYDNAGGNIAADGPASVEFYKVFDKQTKEKKITAYAPDFNEYINFYKSILAPLYKKKEDLTNEDQNLNLTGDCEKIMIKPETLTQLYNLFNGTGCMPVTIRCSDTCNVIKIILSLKKFDCKNHLLQLIRGETTLPDIGSEDKYVKLDKFALRNQNVGVTVEDLNRLRNVAQQLIMQLNPLNCKQAITDLKELDNSIKEILDALNKSALRISSITKSDDSINDAILGKTGGKRFFKDYSLIDLNSYVYSFQARNEMAITPVFGYAYYGFQKGFNGFTPYLGFQVNFQGLNRDDPFNQIKQKTIWQRLCLTTAWTLAGVEEKNKRYDLFNKSSLITALGCKFSHVIMLNVGVLWFKNEDPDPLVSKKNIALTPVISLSINLEIEKLLNGFTKLIPVK